MKDRRTPALGLASSEPPPVVGPEAGTPLEVDVGGRGAFMVGAGIFLSRIIGLLRESIFAHYLGNSVPAAAFKVALRIPNFLQNLFGEGVLSASFIPVYARLIGKQNREEADRVAGAVFGLLGLATAVLVAGGVLATPVLVELIAPGFEGEARDLTVLLVRIFFPGVGLLVMSAWCLGILNSHRRFFLSYASPVIWSGAQIAALLIFGRGSSPSQLVVYVAYGMVLGSFLQFAVQVPTVLRMLGRFRPALIAATESVRQVIRGFVPVVMGRGVVQVSAFVDTIYATLISPRAVAALGYAQIIYLLPVSLFGMAVSAAELPLMSQASGSAEEVASKLRDRLNQGLRRIAFFVIPSAAAFLFLGDVVAGAILQTGRFTVADTRYAWYLLIGSAVGLLAATMGRLYASTFYALRDTRTPLYFAALRVALGAGLAYLTAIQLPSLLGFNRELGGVGITFTSGVAAWIEFLLLRKQLRRRIGRTGLPGKFVAALWGCATGAAAIGLAIKLGLVLLAGASAPTPGAWEGRFLAGPALPAVVTGAIVLGVYGALYFAFTALLGVPESVAVLRRLRRG